MLFRQPMLVVAQDLVCGTRVEARQSIYAAQYVLELAGQDAATAPCF